MKSPLTRIRLGAFVLGAIFLLAVAVFSYSGEYDTWQEAVWFVVITIASVGYGEHSQFSSSLQLFTVFLVLFGMSAAAYTFSAFLQLLLAGELDRVIGHRLMTREIDQLQRHTIVCGFGRIGRILAADLARHKHPFVVIEQNEGDAREAMEASHLCILGDATEDETLLSAGVHRAQTLITGLPNDAANVFITLTARNLNRDLQIIARAEHSTTERKLRQAGADRVVMPATIGAQQMTRMITRPTTADLMELLAEQGNLNVEIDELIVREESLLAKKTIRESQAHPKYGLLLLAVKQGSQGMIFNPAADYCVSVGDIIIVMGQAENITKFRAAFQL